MAEIETRISTSNLIYLAIIGAHLFVSLLSRSSDEIRCGSETETHMHGQVRRWKV